MDVQKPNFKVCERSRLDDTRIKRLFDKDDDDKT